MSSILVLDENSGRAAEIELSLKQKGYNVSSIEDGESANKILRKAKFDAVLFSMESIKHAPKNWLRNGKSEHTNTAFILISGQNSTQQPDEETIQCLDGFVNNPFRADELELSLQKALKNYQAEGELSYLRHERGLVYQFESIIGTGPKITEMKNVLKKVVETDITVLILGETGTGKELIAGAVHYSSPRKTKPFIKVNCAALPETLLESELFGHEKGSFTGAHRQRIGRIEQAHEGTLFLDEIAEMSLGMQSKLLRVLQQKEFERVGGAQTIKVDIRLIAATNRDLKEAIAQGIFREDLFYRLNVFAIQMPSLRDRKEDILDLANHFYTKYSGQYGKHIKGFSKAAQQTLINHPWPGNVRELENSVERAVLLAESDNEIQVKDLGLLLSSSLEPDKEYYLQLPHDGIKLKDLEKQLILQALERTHWIQKDAAKLLGLSKRVINYRIKQYKITCPRWGRHKEAV